MLKSLILYNFRNYKSASFSFSEGINYIHGPNAVGKTALLEAIGLFITGRSFRTDDTEELVKEGATSFYLEAHFVTHQIPQTLSISYESKKKRILHNGTPLPNLSSLFGILRGTILLPEDEMLIKGSPSHRRLYCDLNLAQLKPLYIYHLSRYGRALKQRNALLKQRREEHLFLFEKEMALSGSYLLLLRKELVEALNREIAQIHPLLSDQKELLELTFVAQLPLALSREALESLFLERLVQERKRALLVGHSNIGPHRDDIKIFLTGKEAKDFASEGQKRLSATTLRLAQWHHLRMHSESVPLLCVDDIGLALDQTRSRRLYDYIQGLGQLFLTSYQDPPSFLTNLEHIELS